MDSNDTATGWDAIVKECERVYPGQDNPKHYGTLIGWRVGGNDPLDGISIYDGGDYWHFVTFGLTDLFDKQQGDDPAVSGYGMEFTLKLKKSSLTDEEAEIKNICGIFQSVARLTFTKGEAFRANEYLYTGQTDGMDTQRKSKITGFITIPDTNFNSIDTPNGKVDFVEFIGATDAELKAILNKQTTVRDLYAKLGSDITDYGRDSVI